MCHASSLFDKLLSCLNYRPHSDTIVIHQLFWFPAMRDFTNSQFVDFNPLSSNGTQNGITESSVCIVVFHREDSPMGRSPTLYQGISVDRSDAVEIDDASSDTGCMQLIVRFQRLKQGYTRGDDREGIGGALSENLAASDMELLFWPIEHRTFGLPART